MVNINWTIFWEVINFLVLMWLLKRFLYGPVVEILDKRSKKIENDLTKAEEQRNETNEIKEKHQAELKKTRREAHDVIEAAEKRGREKARQIIAEAKEEAERMKENKLFEVEQAKKEALNEVKQHVASLSLIIAGKILQEKLDQNRHEDMINQYIEKLENKRLGELQ